VDAVHRADVHAGTVFDVDAGLGDDVGHCGNFRGRARADSRRTG
jgi:hypothetical protein